ncbi:hypothetical protein ACFSRY_04310 [Pontibacter locisalis]|uniref:Uncharacterized protein n=1 Tax=Pontibacter locisalis TaxID=1719035 RepID=A0ABW5IHH2_9BACT
MHSKFILSLISILILSATQVFAHGDYTTEEVSRTVVKNGVGLGAVIAVVASWSRNESVLWAIIHGIFSWFYVIYFVITRRSYNRY